MWNADIEALILLKVQKVRKFEQMLKYGHTFLEQSFINCNAGIEITDYFQYVITSFKNAGIEITDYFQYVITSFNHAGIEVTDYFHYVITSFNQAFSLKGNACPYM